MDKKIIKIWILGICLFVLASLGKQELSRVCEQREIEKKKEGYVEVQKSAQKYMESYTAKLTKKLVKAGVDDVVVSYKATDWTPDEKLYDEYGGEFWDYRDMGKYAEQQKGAGIGKKSVVYYDAEDNYAVIYTITCSSNRLDTIYAEHKNYRDVCEYIKPVYKVLQSDHVNKEMISFKSDRDICIYVYYPERVEIKSKEEEYILEANEDDEYTLYNSYYETLYTEENEEDDEEEVDEEEEDEESGDDGSSAIHAGGMLPSGGDSSSGSSHHTNNSSTNHKKKKYDPYDVWDYDDADDFADDWAEDFGDGDYDDGYDDAYDYWEEKHR
ncbi:MAG: hypothetical protein Q4F98_09065 [Lachnospiraceae bacterium]|nr:hypothetical protein [Lachnospiraceae bacterium]